MALSLQQVQRQTQRLIMTPQMQQSIQLLQMNSMDLEMLIRGEMLENPFLELGDDEENLQSAPEAEDAGPDQATADAEAGTGLSDEAKDSLSKADSVIEANDFEAFDSSNFSAPSAGDYAEEGREDPGNVAEGSEEFNRAAETDFNAVEEFADSDPTSYADTKEDSEENDFTTYTGTAENLYDSLMRQLQLSILADRNAEIGKFIIGNLNNDGYLDCSLPNQCLIAGYPSELVEPEIAGPTEKVDEILRKMLAKLHGGENPDAFIGMKRKELMIRISADVLKMTYDELASASKEELLKRLLARRLKISYEVIADMPQSDLILETIAVRLKSTPEIVFDVLEVIQEFEPTGIGARDLAECLRLQCEEKEIRNRLLYKILDKHLHDLQQKRFREIAKALEVPEEKVTEVFTQLSRLDPRPGATKHREVAHYITPDVHVKKVDGKYMYFLNEGDAARLKVAANYRRMMAAKQARRHAALGGVAVANPFTAVSLTEAPNFKPTTFAGGALSGTMDQVPKATADADYATEKYKSAVWLIRNIEKRKSTILRVTEAIMEYQKEFLEKGIEHLRPLTLRDIAERVGMHESTIARVTTKKYVETPRGIFELKYFFSSGLETDGGEEASSRSIKELLTQMINAEEKRRPLSDQKIADMLNTKGFQIARRTVAKYREQLKILPAKLRKEVK